MDEKLLERVQNYMLWGSSLTLEELNQLNGIKKDENGNTEISNHGGQENL